MYIRVEVIAGARREIIKKTGSDSYSISVREKAERNLANRRILELVSKEFHGQRVMAKIVSGHHSPNKIISVQIVEKTT